MDRRALSLIGNKEVRNSRQRAFSLSLVSVVATKTTESGLKVPFFSLGWPQTGSKGPPHGPGRVLGLEDPLVPAGVTNRD
jgi:hypothetical protein